jgi:hypothetical protein
MKNPILYLPGFHLQSLRRTPRSASQKLADEHKRLRQHSLSELSACFGQFIPHDIFHQSKSGAFSRRRLFSKENTFWAFFSQILDADGGCREVIRKVQALAAAKDFTLPSSSTSAYCQARHKLKEDTLDSLLTLTGDQLQNKVKAIHWKNHRVVVVDGTGVSMPDTEKNQSQWPQQSSQTPGCGFPQARICACFCLQSGALLSYRMGSRKRQELPLLREQWDTFESGDILLGDKGFCSYYDVWQLQKRGVQSVFTLARRTPANQVSCVSVLGKDDLLIQWPKPKWNKRLSYSKEEWEALPPHLNLRQIKVTIDHPGFRTQGYYLITTLTNDKVYPTKDLADLYFQRWDAELFFRDIKTTMGMDILRCHTPEMVKKEILMHWLVYNCLRLLMVQAAHSAEVQPREISFKASLQALRQWEPHLNQVGLSSGQRRHLMDQLRTAIASSILSNRPGRREPRCVKRRPKPFALLTKPRDQMIEIPHRSRYVAKTA